MPRFVILQHELPQGHSRASHWDVMLEWGPELRTWALADELTSEREIRGEELPAHRLAYLEYEGPISGNRGTVTRFDAGEYRLARSAQDVVEAVLAGSRLRGKLSLRKESAPHFWRVSFSAEPTTA